MLKMGLVDDSDNLHAQQDDNGKPAYGQSLTDTVNRGAAKVGQQLAYGMKLNADEHLSRTENPVLDITKKGIDTFGKSGAEHQDESAGLLMQAGFENMRHGAVSDTHTREIDSTANGKDKLGMVTDGLENEFVTKPQTAFWSIGSMASEGIRHAAPEGSTDSTSYNYAESKRSGFQQKENDYERQSMSLKDIWDNENAENTVNNASQYFYEGLGTKAPYAAIAALRPLLQGTTLASRLFGASLYGTARNQSYIRQKTGESDYPKAMLGGAINATAGELPFLNRAYGPARQSQWADLVAYIAKHAIQSGTDRWIIGKNKDNINR